MDSESECDIKVDMSTTRGDYIVAKLECVSEWQMTIAIVCFVVIIWLLIAYYATDGKIGFVFGPQVPGWVVGMTVAICGLLMFVMIPWHISADDKRRRQWDAEYQRAKLKQQKKIGKLMY